MYYVVCGEITLTMGDTSWQIAVCLPNMLTSVLYCQTPAQTQAEQGSIFLQKGASMESAFWGNILHLLKCYGEMFAFRC